MSPGQDHRRSQHTFVTPAGATKPLPVTGEDVGGGSDVARPEHIIFGKDGAGVTGQLLLDAVRALVTAPRGDENLPFQQDVAGNLIAKLFGGNTTALKQDLDDRLEVFLATPAAFGPKNLVRARIPILETAMFLGPVGETTVVDFIHIANSDAAVIRTCNIWITSGGAGTLDDVIASALPVPSTGSRFVRIEGPFTIPAGFTLRANASLVDRLTMTAEGRRTF